MRSFYYRPGKNAVLAIFMAGLALVCGTFWWNGGGGIIALALAALFAAAAVKGALNAMNSEPALKFDGDAVWVRTTFGGVQEVPWREVQRIALEVLTIRYWGFIPIGRTETLCIACDGGSLGTRRLRVSAAAITLPVGGGAGLVHILQQAHLEAVGEAGVAMAGAGKNGWGASSQEQHEEPTAKFDPDEVVARYLASREAAQPNAGPSVRPAMVQPAMPPRPVFGRRVS
jgi:hypothetical protein